MIKEPTVMDDESKQKAAAYLRQIADISKGATKTAFVSFVALTIIWVTQIRPQYNQLLHYVYPTFDKFERDKKTLDTFKENRRDVKPVAFAVAVEISKASEPRDTRGDYERLQKRIEKKTKAIKIKRSELESIVKNISFDVLGFKVPVSPLFAAVVWSTVLLLLLLYLAQARSSVWSLCADLLYTLKGLGKKAEALDEIAGNGPLWLAPPPSRPGKAEAVTTGELRSAFGWNHLETLPSIAATTGFLLLSLLQLGVATQGYDVINAARTFTTSIAKPEDAARAHIDVDNPQFLNQKITDLANSLGQPDDSEKKEGSVSNSYLFEQQLAELTVTRVWGSLLSVFLFLTLAGTVMMVVWWFRPWKVPGRFAGYSSTPQRRAKIVLLVAAVLAFCLLIAGLKPECGLKLAAMLSITLPVLTLFLGGTIVTFCLIELLILALLPAIPTQRD